MAITFIWNEFPCAPAFERCDGVVVPSAATTLIYLGRELNYELGTSTGLFNPQVPLPLLFEESLNEADLIYGKADRFKGYMHLPVYRLRDGRGRAPFAILRANVEAADYTKIQSLQMEIPCKNITYRWREQGLVCLALRLATAMAPVIKSMPEITFSEE